MNITRVKGIYFSPTDTTKEIVTSISKEIADYLNVPCETISYTLPNERKTIYSFSDDELIIWGTPVYAGRIPNKTLDYVKNALHGNNTPMIPVAVFGNRSVDNALSELTGIMKKQGGIPIAGAAIIARHSFSNVLANGRPDENDFKKIKSFCEKIAEKIRVIDDVNISHLNLTVCGEEQPEKYYVPKMEDGRPAKFLKAMPLIDESKCSKCGICARVCSMGSIVIDKDGMPSCHGICIKCQACVRKCPKKAVYFEDEAFLSHVRMIEKNFAERKEPMFFV